MYTARSCVLVWSAGVSVCTCVRACVWGSQAWVSSAGVQGACLLVWRVVLALKG